MHQSGWIDSLASSNIIPGPCSYSTVRTNPARSYIDASASSILSRYTAFKEMTTALVVKSLTVNLIWSWFWSAKINT